MLHTLCARIHNFKNAKHKHHIEVPKRTQGLQVQALTRDCSVQGEAGQVQPAGLLKHVLGLQNLGVGLSSKSQQATLLCTGTLHSLHGANMYSFMRCVICMVCALQFHFPLLFSGMLCELQPFLVFQQQYTVLDGSNN